MHEFEGARVLLRTGIVTDTIAEKPYADVKRGGGPHMSDAIIC